MSIKIITTGWLVFVAIGFGSLLPTRAVSAKTNSVDLGEKLGTKADSTLKGRLQGYDAVTGLNIHEESTGTSTLLGKFSMTMDVVIDPMDLSDTGMAQWTAANGDYLYTSVAGFALPGPEFFTITETHTIVGGTGRFEGAEGSFTVMRLHAVAPNEDGTHDIFGSFAGSIVFPKSSSW